MHQSLSGFARAITLAVMALVVALVLSSTLPLVSTADSTLLSAVFVDCDTEKAQDNVEPDGPLIDPAQCQLDAWKLALEGHATVFDAAFIPSLARFSLIAPARASPAVV